MPSPGNSSKPSREAARGGGGEANPNSVTDASSGSAAMTSTGALIDGKLVSRMRRSTTSTVSPSIPEAAIAVWMSVTKSATDVFAGSRGT
ncbi:hypothetical protein Mal15_01510 [Stieleria maiorica]|uniref:Uncharacterized protein n=1 Tax=Stieleria maiorica TaxID=2795974 RepID=A0A5B9M948_9BACT|nr:hypothetical protein Mal15_01510 [Stieleria maiorica]